MENEKVYHISDILTNTCNFPFTEYESHQGVWLRWHAMIDSWVQS